MNKKIIGSMLFAAVAASGTANAAITTDTILNFNKGESATPNVESTPGNIGMLQSAYAGHANIAPIASGNCAGINAAGCYYEDGLVMGIVGDSSNPVAHIHRGGTAANRSVMYHSDSSGIYIRAQDSTAFSLTSFNFDASPGDENPDANGTYISANTGEPVTGVAGANDYWEILGYSSALNPTLNTDANSGSKIARQTVTNGFNGNVTLSSAFDNISAFWIHYAGYQQTPADGKQFGMTLDNVHANAAVAAVPLPAAAWMFLSGMMGLLAFGKKKARLAA
jgi:hypothetical protein